MHFNNIVVKGLCSPHCGNACMQAYIGIMSEVDGCWLCFAVQKGNNRAVLFSPKGRVSFLSGSVRQTGLPGFSLSARLAESSPDFRNDPWDLASQLSFWLKHTPLLNQVLPLNLAYSLPIWSGRSCRPV